jgi:hypothetical protein
MESRSVGSSRSMWVSMVVAVWVVAGAVGCASAPMGKERAKLAGLSDFGLLLFKAGVPLEKVPEGEEVTPEQADEMLLLLKLYPATPRMYTQREVAERLLQQVLVLDRPVTLTTMLGWMSTFNSRVMLRPDGYLANALTGDEAQCVGPVQVKDGKMMAETFEVGELYLKELTGWQPAPLNIPSRRLY